MKNKPVCKLVGTDGNVFSIIGNVVKTLKKHNMIAESKEFQQRAFGAESYDEVLALVHEYVDVE